LKFFPIEKRYPQNWVYDDLDYMIEDPVPYQETWEALEELVQEGLIKSIGMSNVGCSLIRDVMAYSKIKPAVLQQEIHPYNSSEKIVKFCHLNKIHVTAYSSFGAASYHELGVDKSASLLENPTVADLAKKIGKTSGQVCLKWATQRGLAIIPKTSNADRLIENASAFDWELSAEDMKTLSDLNTGKRFNDPGMYTEPRFGFILLQ
jgi:D-xylose reductase